MSYASPDIIKLLEEKNKKIEELEGSLRHRMEEHDKTLKINQELEDCLGAIKQKHALQVDENVNLTILIAEKNVLMQNVAEELLQFADNDFVIDEDRERLQQIAKRLKEAKK